MKITPKKVRYIINHKKNGESSKTIVIDMKISKRRVEQIWKYYSETGKEPIIGKNLGRPEKPLDPKEVEIVKIAFERYKFGARMLEKIIDGFYEMHIPHNRIHDILLSEGLAKEEESKKKRRKWIRYEREHSLSAGHIDWYEADMTDIKVCVILDELQEKFWQVGSSQVLILRTPRRSSTN